MISNNKRAMALLMTVVFFILSAENIVLASSATSENGQINATLTLNADTSQQIVLVRSGSEINGVTFKGDEARATNHRLTYPITSVKDTDGTAGYCISLFSRGTSPNGEQQVLNTVPYSQLDNTDKQLLGIMMAGYPNISTGWTKEDEYMATQIAIQHFVLQHSDKYPNIKGVRFDNDSWDHWVDEPIIELAKLIYEAGINTPYEASSSSVDVIIDSSNGGVFQEIGESLELTLDITVNGTFTKGKLTFDSIIRNIVKTNADSQILVGSRTANFKAGILGVDDHEEGIEILPGDATVKIILNKRAAESYMDLTFEGDTYNGSYSGSKEVEFTFSVVGGSTMQAFKGINANANNQNYVIFAPGEMEPITQSLMLASSDAWEYDETIGGKGGLKILKYNKKTNTLVAGAIFEIRGVSETNWDFLVHIQASPGAALPLPDGGTARTGTGFIELIDIRPGQYQITEITPPPNFDYCDFGVNSQVVTVIEGEDSGLYPQVRFENNPYAKLRIKKINSVTGEPANGAILRVRNALADFDMELTTMNGGIIELENLPQGNYEISEVFAPNEYVKSDEVKVATLRWGETTEISYENTPKTELQVIKISSEDGANLQGAIFRLTKPDTGDVWEDETYYDGRAIFSNIPAGTYVLEEIRSPDGFELDTSPRTIFVENYKSNEVYVQNDRTPGLTIIKRDKDTQEYLSGGVFEVEKIGGTNAGPITGSPFTTDENGKIVLDQIEPASYKISEIIPPSGYNLSDPNYQIINMLENQDNVVTFENTRKPNFSIYKVDVKTSLPIEGAEFTIEKLEEPGKGMLTGNPFTTDSSGRIVLDNLPSGSYQIVETKPANGYMLPEKNTHIITITENEDYELRIENIKLPIFILTKTNALTNKGVPNTRFSIKRENGDGSITNLGTYVTDKNGQIIIPNAQVGWYIVEETVPAPGMSLPKDPVFRFYLAPGENAYAGDNTSTGKEQEGDLADYNDGSVTITYGEDYILGNEIIDYPLNSLVVKKVSSVDLSMLGGAVFELRKVSEDVTGSSGALIARFTTPASGIAVITGLEPGGYIVEEVSPPMGFTLSENSQQQIWIKYDNTSISEQTFTNTPYGNLLITKANQLNQPLPGARFTVTEADGSLIGTQNDYVTDADGKILIEGIKPGTSVVISEKEAPPNHTLLGTPQTVQIGYEGKTHTVHFVNEGYANLLISKVNQLNQPLASARFKVTRADGTVIGNSNGEYVSDINGEILIDGIPIGTSVHITELEAPPNHTISTESQIVEIKSPGETHTVRFVNQGYGHLLISKVNQDNQPLANARFKITAADGGVLGNGNGEYISDINGEILVENIPIGTSVVATELEAPPNHQLVTTPQTIEINKPGEIHTLRFVNESYGGLIIRKFSSEDNSPLANAVFSVKRINGEVIGNSNGIFTTDNNGLIEIPNVYGDLEIVEIQAPENFHLEQQTKTIRIEPNTIHTEDFWNAPYGNLLIRKFTTDGQPLSGAQFLVTDDKGTIWGNNNGLYTTDQSGQILIENVFGTLIIKEEKAPDHYILDNQSQTIKIEAGRTHTADFYNKRKSGVTIWKFGENRQPLAGSVYKLVKLPTNEEIGTYTIPPEGFVTIDDLSPGVYSAYEVSSPSTHVLDSTPKQFEITGDEHIVLEFFNNLKSSIIIHKKDEQDGTPLSSVLFEVRTQNGTFITEVESDESGTATIPSLEPGFYVLKELRQKEGYAADNESRVVEVKANTPTVITWTNRKLGGLTVSKLNSVTRQPISSVEFQLSHMNGERIGIFKTGNDGQFHVPDLQSGWYTLVETWVDEDQYVLDASPINFEIVSGNEPKFIEVLNDPLPILTVIKTDQDGNPLQGVLFEVRKENGELIGTTYKTDHRGRFEISDDSLPDGKIYIYELEALPGYKQLTEPVEAIIRKGKATTVRIVNESLGGLRLYKRDSITGAGIYNVEFVVYDSNNKIVGNFYTDSEGVIDFSAILTEGRYTIRESRPAAGYYSDDIPRTIEIVSGKVTEIIWENTPEMGQIQVTKLSEDDNEVNGFPAGTPLAGAIFELYSYKNGNLVDRFETGVDGRGVSQPLPLGRYLLKEVQAPPYYQLNSKEMDITVEFATQIIKLEYTNQSANTGVSIKKTGNMEAMPGDQIRYDIKSIRNDSTIALTDFFWRDVLPTDAVRLNKIVTGTFNQSLRYKITATTNKGNSLIIADNLSTTQNHVIDCSNASLGLFTDEYVTSFSVIYGNVKAGFTTVEQPQVFVDVLKTLPTGYQFANKCDVGGKTGSEWVIGNSTWVTTIYRGTDEKLPKTGY